MNSRRKAPRLLNINTKGEEWKRREPRPTEEQKERISELLNKYHRMYGREVNRRNFAKVHERMEDEIADRIESEFGMWAALEWVGVLSEHNYRVYKSVDPELSRYVEPIIPMESVMSHPLFEHIEEFQPRVVLQSFKTYTGHMDATEQSIKQAERRRARGDAYFTKRDQAIKYSTGSTPEPEAEDV